MSHQNTTFACHWSKRYEVGTSTVEVDIYGCINRYLAGIKVRWKGLGYKKMFRILKITTLIALLLWVYVSMAGAETITWTLDDVQFDDGTMVTGTFVYDSTDPYIISEFNIATYWGSDDFPGNSYIRDPSNPDNTTALWGVYGQVTASEPNYWCVWFILYDPPNNYDPNWELVLRFKEQLRFGGTINLLTDGPGPGVEYFRDSQYNRQLTGGSITEETVPDVPEPATMLLLGLGLFGLMEARRRFQR